MGQKVAGDADRAVWRSRSEQPAARTHGSNGAGGDGQLSRRRPASGEPASPEAIDAADRQAHFSASPTATSSRGIATGCSMPSMEGGDRGGAPASSHAKLPEDLERGDRLPPARQRFNPAASVQAQRRSSDASSTPTRKPASAVNAMLRARRWTRSGLTDPIIGLGLSFDIGSGAKAARAQAPAAEAFPCPGAHQNVPTTLVVNQRPRRSRDANALGCYGNAGARLRPLARRRASRFSGCSAIRRRDNGSTVC